MYIKQGVKIDLLTPQALLALMVAKDVYEKDHQVELVLTSGNDGSHSSGSLHYGGNAIDIRIWNLPDSVTPEEVRDQIAERLGENYDVVLESTHIHIEYDP